MAAQDFLKIYRYFNEQSMRVHQGALCLSISNITAYRGLKATVANMIKKVHLYFLTCNGERRFKLVNPLCSMTLRDNRR